MVIGGANHIRIVLVLRDVRELINCHGWWLMRALIATELDYFCRLELHLERVAVGCTLIQSCRIAPSLILEQAITLDALR